MTYRIVPTNDDDTENDWRCSTRSYMYALEHVGTGQQIAAWHWHPHTTFTNPHLHIGSSQLGATATLTNKMHLGAGRTSFEHIVCPSIDAGAVPLRKYWQDQLALTQGVFEIYRTWGTNPPARVIDLREGRHRKSE